MGWWKNQKARSDNAKNWPGGRVAYAKAKAISKDGTKSVAAAKVDAPHQVSNLIEAMLAYGYRLDQQSATGGKTLLTFIREEQTS